ncbi:hypothetical protein AAG570_009159 [Ranatra chinensis]|uniref:Vacuolar protein sorting-associated protein 33B n=1 Tax=Ranatra chinensis TaxID=642074 RepID=A0ABD0YSX7_9HEMI
MAETLDQKLGALAQISQRKLTDILDRIAGTKDFIIHPDLIKPLERIMGVSILRSHGVDKIYKLEKSAPTPCTSNQRVFFIPSDMITLKYVCDKITSEISSSGSERSYHIVFVSGILGCLIQLLEEEGIYGKVRVYPFHWELIRLDSRLLSIEYPTFFKNVFLEGDHSYLSCIARSIWSLQMLLGKPRTTFIQGKLSHLVHEMVNMLSDTVQKPEREDCDIACFIIVDRSVDYVTPLLTSATYTGLLDEVFGIRSGTVEIKGETINLSSADEVYSEVNTRHFSDVYSFLGAKTKELNEELNAFKRSHNMALQEMKAFINQQLQSLMGLKKSLSTHITACEAIIDKMADLFEALITTEHNIIQCQAKRENVTYIEETMAMESADKFRTLRLMGLLSLAQGGLLSEEVADLKSQFLHAHGYENLPCFLNLEKLGILTTQAGLLPHDLKGVALANRVVQAVMLAQKLHLLPETSMDPHGLRNPKDMSYVFSGAYIPIICQLVNFIIKLDTPLEEMAKLIPNCSVFLDSNSGRKPLRSFLVYFLGGVTFAEVAAFRLLEKLTGSRIVIAGTTITNGNQIVKACL